jgi:site-specific DNA recombinase
MKAPTAKPSLRCAIYARVSTDARLEQEFNSLDAQREASEAYIRSQTHEGWSLVRARYDDGGFSGGSMERPALQKLLLEVQAKRIDVIVVYKVDRLTRSLADFAKLVEMFDAHGVSFVSVTQSFNTTTSMGRLTLNVLLSFAQFEREVTGERIRDKIAASKKKGIWMGGVVPLGYRVESRALHIVEDHAELVRGLLKRYLEVGSVARLKEILDAEDIRLPMRIDGKGRSTGGGLFSRGHIYKIFSNPIYIGQIAHKGLVHEGQHPTIVDRELWVKVQHTLEDHLQSKSQRRERQSTNALLAGKLFDDRGNPMTPSWSRRGSKRWSYYVSQAILRGDKANAGSVARVSAPEVERRVIEAIGSLDQGRKLQPVHPGRHRSRGYIPPTPNPDVASADNADTPFGHRERIRSRIERVTLEWGFGLTRLIDLPMAWSEQWGALGLEAPARS